MADDIKINVSKISIKEDKDLLLNLSVLIEPARIGGINEFLEGKKNDGFSFQLAGPFPPYSFAENDA